MEDFKTLYQTAKDLRKELECKERVGQEADKLCKLCKESKKCKKHLLIFAYNRTGKTRLSMKFKDLGKNTVNNTRDTLYFNAFTEDLFPWNNDLDGDKNRHLEMKTESRFFDGFDKPILKTELKNKIDEYLKYYAEFKAHIKYKQKEITFSRGNARKIKISRGEQNIFIWCVFLAIAEIAIDGDPTYAWVKYIYIDDPISSLDDGNTISLACDIERLLKKEMAEEKESAKQIKVVISSHHALFFSVLSRHLESRKFKKYFLKKDNESKKYCLANIDKKKKYFIYHVARLIELKDILDNNKPLHNYHFNILRSILEKTATFTGQNHFSCCIKRDDDNEIPQRALDVFSHGNYPLDVPNGMSLEDRALFKKILNEFIDKYHFKI